MWSGTTRGLDTRTVRTRLVRANKREFEFLFYVTDEEVTASPVFFFFCIYSFRKNFTSSTITVKKP